jgi:hypothetical protein
MRLATTFLPCRLAWATSTVLALGDDRTKSKPRASARAPATTLSIENSLGLRIGALSDDVQPRTRGSLRGAMTPM